MFKYFLRSKLFGSIVSVAILFSVLSLAACVDGPGSGTSSDPFLIRNAAQLKALADEVNGGDGKSGVYYKLAANIDLSAYGAGYDNGKGWAPIGNAVAPFKGNFNGSCKVISGLFIGDNTLDYAGLFGYVSGGEVKNIGVELATEGITGNDFVGGVAGAVDRSAVSCCYATGNVSGNNSVGGVTGLVKNGNVSTCYVTGNISGNDSVGGAAGLVDGSTVSYCYATGNVSGNDSVGGVLGQVYSGSNVIACLAFNEEIKRVSGTNTTFGRVVGSNAGRLIFNMALSPMTVAGTSVTTGNKDDENGVNAITFKVESAKDQLPRKQSTNLQELWRDKCRSAEKKWRRQP